jgi:hypothetical protein
VIEYIQLDEDNYNSTVSPNGKGLKSNDSAKTEGTPVLGLPARNTSFTSASAVSENNKPKIGVSGTYDSFTGGSLAWGRVDTMKTNVTGRKQPGDADC